jgi:hypothetical protein
MPLYSAPLLGLMGWFEDIDERIMQPTFRMRKTRSVGHSYFRCLVQLGSFHYHQIVDITAI